MSQEAQVQCGLTIRSQDGALDFQSRPQSFIADVAGRNGPTPGAVTVPSAGVNVSFSQLTAYGGLAFFFNLSTTVTVYIGIKDAFTGKFYPLFQLNPLEGYVMRLADIFAQDYGTGTLAEGTDSMHLRPKTINGIAQTAIVSVEAFDP